MLPRMRTNPARAQLATDYHVTDDYCIELYYMITGPAILTVKTRDEDYIERNITSATVHSKVMAHILQSCQGMYNLHGISDKNIAKTNSTHIPHIHNYIV